MSKNTIQSISEQTGYSVSTVSVYFPARLKDPGSARKP